MDSSVCTVEGCSQPHSARGYCTGHYQRLRLKGDVQAGVPLQRQRRVSVAAPARGAYTRHALPDGLVEPSPDGLCVVPACTTELFKRSLCIRHYNRWQRNGTVYLPGDVGATTGTCRVATCDRPAALEGHHGASGYCDAHLRRVRNYGDPRADDPIRVVGQDAATYVTEHIDRSGGPNACWPWTGPINKQGYGQINVGKLRFGAVPRAHRVALEMSGVAVPTGLDVDHTCHWKDWGCPGGTTCLHRRCCNPSHLEVVTPTENLQRNRRQGGLCYAEHPITSQELEVWATCSECGERHRVPERLWFRIALSRTRHSRSRGA